VCVCVCVPHLRVQGRAYRGQVVKNDHAFLRRQLAERRPRSDAPARQRESAEENRFTGPAYETRGQTPQSIVHPSLDMFASILSVTCLFSELWSFLWSFNFYLLSLGHF